MKRESILSKKIALVKTGKMCYNRHSYTEKGEKCMIKAIWIDIDDTLLDFDAYVRQTMQTGFAKFGLCTYTPEMYLVFTEENNALWHQIEQNQLTFSELEKIRWNRVFARLGISFDGTVFERYFRACLYDSAILETGAAELLAALQGNYLLYVASNGPYEQQLHRLEIAGIKSYFDGFFISEKIGASKPSREFFDAAFAAQNAGRSVPITPAETLILGDSFTSDIAGGKAYGMHTCYYLRGRKPPVPQIADFTVEHLSDFPALLQNIRESERK